MPALLPLIASLAVATLVAAESDSAAPAPQDQIALADQSVLRIITRVDGGMTSGSGFVINDEGMLLTSQHVVDQARQIIVLERLAARNQLHDAQLLVVDDARDLAVVVVPALGRAPLKLRGFAAIKGERATALGFPGAGDRSSDPLGDPDFTESTRTAGEVSRLIDEPWRPDLASLQMVQHTASISRGNSGGPLLDACGRVIGVNTQIVDRRIADSINFASSVTEIAAFLRDRDIPFLSDEETCPPPLQEVALSAPMPTTAGMPTSKILIGGLVGVGLLGLIFWLLRRRLGAAPEVLEPEIETAEGPPVPAAIILAGSVAEETSRMLTLSGRTPKGQEFHSKVKETELRRGVLIGRDRSRSHIVVPDSQVSRRHARLALKDGHLTIEDLGSTNGTYIDTGPAIAAHAAVPVKPGATIRVAKCTIKLSMREG